MVLKFPKKRIGFKYLNPFHRALALYALCPSVSSPGTFHTVVEHKNILGSSWNCDCLDHLFRERDCRHIRQVKEEAARAGV